MLPHLKSFHKLTLKSSGIFEAINRTFNLSLNK